MGKLVRGANRSEKGARPMGQLKLLVSLITDDNDYQLEQAVSAQNAAVELDASIETVFANNDAVHQTQQILTYIQDAGKRPDAILVEPVGTGMPQVAKAAVAAGIGWAVINAEVDYAAQLRQTGGAPVCVVLSDHLAIGNIQGQQIAAILGEKGCVLYVEGPTQAVAGLRTKGMLSAKPAGVDVKTLKGHWTQQSGYHVVKSWLSLSTSRQLNVGMVACQNDDMAVGVRRAFEELDAKERAAWLRLPITGCDGVPKSGQALVRKGLLAATVISPPLVGDAIRLLATALKSGAQPPLRTVVAPSSFPELKALQKLQAKAAEKS